MLFLSAMVGLIGAFDPCSLPRGSPAAGPANRSTSAAGNWGFCYRGPPECAGAAKWLKTAQPGAVEPRIYPLRNAKDAGCWRSGCPPHFGNHQMLDADRGTLSITCQCALKFAMIRFHSITAIPAMEPSGNSIALKSFRRMYARPNPFKAASIHSQSDVISTY